MPSLKDVADGYLPLVTAVISLICVATALLTLYHSRRDRRESQSALAADASRREEEALLASLHGDKEAVGFMALQLVCEPGLVTESNKTRLFCTLCLAFVFESSSRTKSLILKALQQFSKTTEGHQAILGILDEMERDFRGYDVEICQEELTKYFGRIAKLKSRLLRTNVAAATAG